MGPYREGKLIDLGAERRQRLPEDPNVIHAGAPTGLRFVEGHVVDSEGHIILRREPSPARYDMAARIGRAIGAVLWLALAFYAAWRFTR